MGIDVYEQIPVMESEVFLLREIEDGDAEDLLKVYSDKDAVPIFNSDNCVNGFYYTSIEEMKDRLSIPYQINHIIPAIPRMVHKFKHIAVFVFSIVKPLFSLPVPAEPCDKTFSIALLPPLYCILNDLHKKHGRFSDKSPVLLLAVLKS